MIRRRWFEVGGILALVGGLTWAGAWIARDASRGAVVDRARQAARAGRFAEARRLLIGLPASWRAEPEAADLLGAAEHAAGNYEAALAAWAVVPAGSGRGASVALARARTLVGDLGRFAEAEAILESALLAAWGPIRLEIAHTLGQLCFLEGRQDAMRRLIRQSWRDWRDPAAEVRDLWLIDDATVLVDEVRQSLDKAEAHAPDDGRVGLGRASLALLAGRFDEAGRSSTRSSAVGPMIPPPGSASSGSPRPPTTLVGPGSP